MCLLYQIICNYLGRYEKIDIDKLLHNIENITMINSDAIYLTTINSNIKIIFKKFNLIGKD